MLFLEAYPCFVFKDGFEAEPSIVDPAFIWSNGFCSVEFERKEGLFWLDMFELKEDSLPGAYPSFAFENGFETVPKILDETSNVLFAVGEVALKRFDIYMNYNWIFN